METEMQDSVYLTAAATKGVQTALPDRALLERAAKAAGIRLHVWGTKGRENFADMDAAPYGRLWNPLTDDGDALRLAVKLRITITYRGNAADCFAVPEEPAKAWPNHVQPWDGDAGDDAAATRRAIVRAAAALAD